MTRQAIVGAFTIAALLGLFVIFFVLANIGTQGRYKIGVHFKSAAGLHKGALVYESGVNVGLIDSTILQPEDFTVEVIVAVNNGVDIPRNARFIVANPITGDVTLEIVPPREAEHPAGVAILPHEILPLDQQPRGTNPPTVTDLLEEGQGQIQRLDRMLAALEQREPKLLDTLQSALRNMNELTANGNERLSRVTGKLDAMMDTLSVALDASSKNIVDLTGGLNAEVQKNSGHVDSLMRMLDRTARSLNQTVDSVRELATNKDVQKNLIDTTQGLAQTAQTIGAITADLRRVTGNDQTQGQLRDTVANVDAATQKLNSLLAALGGRSSVYGIDRGATPAPAPAPAASPARTGAVPGTPGVVIAPEGGPTATPIDSSRLRARLGSVARDLLEIQVRISELDKPKPGANSSPIFTSDRGPQTDFNLIIRPHGPTRLMTGANDIGAAGGTTTYNFAEIQSLTSQFQVGYGVLYSRLGFLGRYDSGRFSLEGRLYDVRRPTFDAIAGIKLTRKTQLFGGERDALRSGRRTEFGLQLQF